MIGLCLFFAVLGAPIISTESAQGVADAFVAPPGFELTAEHQGHGVAMISKTIERHWAGPNGIGMSLVLDDGESMPVYYLPYQIDYAKEQTKKFYPNENLERAHHFIVNKKDWILIRLRGKAAISDRYRFILLTHLGGIYAQVQFVGYEPNLAEMQQYIELVMRQLSGAKADDPIRAL